MSDVDEVGRLRALLGLMREGKLTRLTLADGTTLERSPLADIPDGETFVSTAQAAVGEPDDDEKDDDGTRERMAERAWQRKWASITASSGAPIPPFPGMAEARRFLGGLS